MCYKSWWTQNAMGYYRLWVITVWVISGLTVVGSGEDVVLDLYVMNLPLHASHETAFYH